jgi:polysaccharide biosynthesis protein PslG
MNGMRVQQLLVDEEGHWLFAVSDQGFLRATLDADLGRDQRRESETGGAAFRQADAPPRYGMHTLVADERTLPLVEAAGFDTVVQLFAWWEIEPTQGQFIWQAADEAVAGAEYYGLNLIVRLDKHPTWANADPLTPGAPPVDLAEYDRWVRRVAARYQGRVAAYIIWNEPNLAEEWSDLPPDPAAYVEVLRVGYQAVKETDPNALVISAGLAPTNTQNEEAMDDRLFLVAMYEAGAADYFDRLGVHPYGFGYPPDDARHAHEGLNLARLQDLREIMLDHGDERRVWITEMGWTIQGNEHSAWQEVTSAQQADYLTAALALIRRNWPWVELITVWNLGGENNPDWGGYSLLEEDGAPRPAYRALQDYGLRQPRPHQPQPASAPLPQRYQVLAEDAVIHLGDKRLGAPWVPLHQDRNPSPVWRGIVYMDDPGDLPWQLTLRIMQSNFWSNRVWVNGEPLPDPFPLEDFSKSWVSFTVPIPAHLLQPGPNEIRVVIGHALPLIQDEGFGYDKLQIKDIVLWCTFGRK